MCPALQVMRWASIAALLGASLVYVAPMSLSARAPTRHLPILRLYYAAGDTDMQADLDPAQGGWSITPLVYANLVHILPNGRVTPDLASHWTLSKNHLVYTFALRPDARFADGHYVTAQDAAFSLERALAASTRSSTALTYLGLIRGADAFHRGEAKHLSGVKVLGRRTLQVTITQPAGYFLGALSYYPGAILDPAVVAGKRATVANNYLTNTCFGNQGAGPFTFVCHDGSSTPRSFSSGRTPMFTLEPNRYFYGRHPRIELELPTSANPYQEYVVGRLDVGPVQPAYVSRWKGTKELLQFPSSELTFLIPNVHTAPFNNVHCRLAVAYAIDRSILATVVHGTERPTHAVVPRGMLGYYSGNDNPHYSPGRARAELAQCPNRTVPFVLKFQNVPDVVNENRAIGQELKNAGMNVKLKAITVNKYFTIASQSLDNSHTQILWSSWFQDYPDPQDYLFLLLHSGAASNPGGWHNRSYDQLVDRADALSNREERATLYIQAQHLALDKGAIIALTNGENYGLVKPYVHGLTGAEAYPSVVPRDFSWANVWIGER